MNENLIVTTPPPSINSFCSVTWQAANHNNTCWSPPAKQYTDIPVDEITDNLNNDFVLQDNKIIAPKEGIILCTAYIRVSGSLTGSNSISTYWFFKQCYGNDTSHNTVTGSLEIAANSSWVFPVEKGMEIYWRYYREGTTYLYQFVANLSYL